MNKVVNVYYAMDFENLERGRVDISGISAGAVPSR